MVQDGKTALVTGANRGIGFEISRQLGTRGFTVFLGSRRETEGKKAVRTLLAAGVDARPVSIDVNNLESITEAFRTVSMDANVLDVLVNNAGEVIDEDKSILDVSPDNVSRSLSTNALGALFVIQEFLPMLKRGSRVINISSGAGEICNGMSSYAPVYSISKTTLNAITCQCAHALRRRGIAVNAVCPGWVRTRMGGMMAPRSVAAGAETPIWLATDAPISETGKFWRDRKNIPW